MGRDVPSRERENQVVLALVLLAVFLSGNRHADDKGCLLVGESAVKARRTR